MELSIATCQMDIAFGPTAPRLERAAALVREAAQRGAELVVLPELFNTGYAYTRKIVAAAEPSDGPTARWLADQARAHRIHLAATFLLRDGGDVFNTALLCAPDGASWRYDKIYPWAWERSAFVGSRRGTVVADTKLGRIGVLICWDTAHTELWAAYARRVQLVLATSCVPDSTSATYTVGDGASFHASDMAGLGDLADAPATLFGPMVDEQAGWLGVPFVNAGMSGTLETRIPRGALAVLPMLRRDPGLAVPLLRGAAVRMACGSTSACRVVDAARGAVATLGVDAGEGVAVGRVVVPASCPTPSDPQPPARLPRSAYLLSDRVLPRLMVPTYRANLAAARGRPRPGVLRRVADVLGLA